MAASFVRSRSRASLTLLLTAVLAACAGSSRLDPAPAHLQGRWSGRARNCLATAIAPDVRATFEIAADGKVTGSVGGARLVDGYLARNRGELGRTLEIKTDYIVRADLDGEVEPGEARRSLVLFAPFDVVELPNGESVLRGGITTCTSRSGGGKDTAMVASDMELARSP